jgi:hypothetical protein
LNYLAHGYKYIDDPYFLAGTALPDWLSVVNRKIRVREKLAMQWIEHDDSARARFAQGVVQHHRDDEWFHQNPAFVLLNQRFLKDVRRYMPSANSMAVWFLAHVLIELLIDAALSDNDGDILETYYLAITQVPPDWIAQQVHAMTGREADRLEWMVGRFNEVQFLRDYQDDRLLLYRLNQVMQRAGLEALDENVAEFFPLARTLVRENLTELVTPPFRAELAQN